MEKTLSDKIKIISFLLMIMVVFLHSYNLDLIEGSEKNLNWFVQNFISYGITRIAVPMFFLISGYLFVYDKKIDIISLLLKTKKRIRTLLIPYLFWTVFGLLFYFLLQNIPQAQPFFTKKLIRDYDFIELVNTIFNEPIPYQLWFLRDLIIMVFLSPLLIFCVRKFKIFFLLVLFFFWFQSKDSIFLTSEAIFFFSSGLYISLFKQELVEIKSSNSIFLILLWLVVLVFKTRTAFFNDLKMLDVMLLKISILIGILAFWLRYDTFQKYFLNRKIFMYSLEFSFFLYLFHEPLLTVIKKIFFFILGKDTASQMIVFCFSPLITILLSIFVGRILKSNFKKVYLFSTGGR